MTVLARQRAIDRATLAIRRARFVTPPGGWIRSIRQALGMTQAELAAILGVNQKSVHRLEISEALRKIQLDSLQRAAEALDCELVYALVPRMTLQSQYEVQARKLAREQIANVEGNMLLEDQIVSFSKSEVEELTKKLIRQRAVQWKPSARGRI